MHSKKAILTPLVYSSLFHFPLTQKELWKFLPVKLSYSAFLKQLSTTKQVVIRGKYVALRNEEESITKRARLEKQVMKKREEVTLLLSPLKHIPWILFIGISGSLGAGQYTQKGDIDLFILTKANTLWLCRVMLLIYLFSKGVLRRKKDIDTKEKFCVNMFLDETAFVFPPSLHDMYIAREIYQLYPVLDKKETFHSFLSQNNWTTHFFPNIPVLKKKKKIISPPFMIQSINWILYKIQLISIKKTQTKERISLHLAAFHPYNYHTRILHRFEAKMSTIRH